VRRVDVLSILAVVAIAVVAIVLRAAGVERCGVVNVQERTASAPCATAAR
jgi:hypothetical protein